MSRVHSSVVITVDWNICIFAVQDLFCENFQSLNCNKGFNDWSLKEKLTKLWPLNKDRSLKILIRGAWKPFRSGTGVHSFVYIRWQSLTCNSPQTNTDSGQWTENKEERLESGGRSGEETVGWGSSHWNSQHGLFMFRTLLTTYLKSLANAFHSLMHKIYGESSQQEMSALQ